MTLFIHIGLHKTGSSLLQRSVFPYLSNEDIVYFGRPYRSKKHFIEDIAWSRGERLLISSETFSGRLLDSYREDKSYLQLQLSGIERLSAAFPFARILVGVRPHGSWILSCYKHYLKYGGSRELSRFFNLEAKAFMKPEDFLLAPLSVTRRPRRLAIHCLITLSVSLGLVKRFDVTLKRAIHSCSVRRRGR